MAGRQQVGAEIPRGLEQIGEFHVLVAGDAGNRRLACDIGARERLDHLLAEALLVVEHVVRNAEPGGDVARVVDVLAGAAGALAMGRRAVVVELHRHADDVVALAASSAATTVELTPPGHRHDDAGVRGRLGEAQAVESIARDLSKGCREHSDLVPAKLPDQALFGRSARRRKPIAENPRRRQFCRTAPIRGPIRHQ